MTQNAQIADAYYNMIQEGLDCIVEDKSVKTHAQAFRMLKKDIKKFAKENNLSFASIPDIISLGGRSLPIPKIINISVFLNNFMVVLAPDDIYHDEIVFNSISDSKYKGALFVVNWLIKDPTKDNLAMLLETVTRMKLNFIACEWNEQIRADAQNK
ncbi:MAG: hypothetical protein II610_01090 [Treponema sp.]|nr:hypothetical protein [Treponema sp.]